MRSPRERERNPISVKHAGRYRSLHAYLTLSEDRSGVGVLETTSRQAQPRRTTEAATAATEARGTEL